MIDRLIPEMAKHEGVTELLKAKDQMAWVGMMNSILPGAHLGLIAVLELPGFGDAAQGTQFLGPGIVDLMPDPLRGLMKRATSFAAILLALVVY